LPLSTLTNVGMFGNGRFFQGLISHLYSTDIPEIEEIGQKTFSALSQVIPQYVRRAKRSDYLVAGRNNMFKLASEMFPNSEAEKETEFPLVRLMDETDDMDTRLFASMLFPFTNKSLLSLRNAAKKFNDETKQKILQAYIGDRQTRRDRPERAFEEGYPLSFELVTNWGVYKDLMRHRMSTQQRQLFTTKLGFDMPEELELAGFKEKAEACIAKTNALYDLIAKEDLRLAQYAVLHGHYTRWFMGLNDRSAMHLLELRTTPQGHPQYRKIGQMMHAEIAKRSKWRAEAMKFVDYNDYYWSRADSEAKQRVKEAELDEKLQK
jgi:thymidylate synthase ThyX